MEPKIIIYIIIGILYFIYSLKKKADEKNASVPSSDDSPPVSKPVSPPDIFHPLKRKSAKRN